MQVELSSLSKFVWTKVGVEAGESLDEILVRKESERLANGGIFLWGVGNNVGSSMGALASQGAPDVLFSLIRTSPRDCDRVPDVVFRWTKAETLEGLPFELPRGSLVTSRGYPRKRFHYAIVCYSDKPLRLDALGTIHAGSLRNLTSGKSVGSSQVTSVVVRDDSLNKGREYTVAMRFRSCSPFFIRLSSPVCISNSQDSEPFYPGDWELLNWKPIDGFSSQQANW